MRKWAALLVCLAMLLMTFSSPVRADMQLPTYQVGDQWVYSINLRLEDMAILSGDWTFEIEGETEFSGYIVYDMSLEGTGTATIENVGLIPYTLEGFTYIRTSDLATVMESMEIEFDNASLPSGVHLSAFVNMSYTPPLNQFDFPIKVGDTWSAVTTTTFEFDVVTNIFPSQSTSLTTSVSADFICEDKETVEVAAGNFQTYKVKMTEADGNTTYTYMSTKSGYMVKMRILDSQGVSLGTMNLKSYSYAPPAGGDGDIFSDLMDLLWLFVLLIIVILVVVVALLARRRGKGQETPAFDSPESEQFSGGRSQDWEETNK